MSTACLTVVPQLHGPYQRRASPTGHGRVFYAVTAFKSNTPRISWVAASASRSFSLSCALSRWPSARSGRGLEAFLQLCALRRTRPTLQASPVTLQRAQGFATKRERASRILNKISGTVTIERVSRSIRHETITSVRLELMIEQPTNSDGRGSRVRASVHQSRCGNDPA